MSTLLPQDSDNNPIPALGLKAGGAHNISATAVAARNSTAFDHDTRVVGVYADVPLYITFGDNSVNATTADHYFPAGLYYDFSIGGGRSAHHTHISVLIADTDGIAYISEKE